MKLKLRIPILVAGVMAGVLSYWLNAYNEFKVLGIHIYAIALVTTGVASYVFSKKYDHDPKIIFQNLIPGFLLAVVGRIAFDISTWDSTSHNLAPLEIIIMFVIISLSTIVGAKIGEVRNPEK